MSALSRKRGFADRPSDPETWVRADNAAHRAAKNEEFTARLTIDVTPQMRGRIKIAAFRSGRTAADMLRAILEREFPAPTGGAGEAP